MRSYKISNKRCKHCGGLISWDDYPDQKWPIHVNENGSKIGTGTCPKLHPLSQPAKPNNLSKVPLSRSVKKRFPFNFRLDSKHLIVMFAIVGIIFSISFLGIMFSMNRMNTNPNPYIPHEIPEDPDDETEEPFYWEIDGEGNATLIVDGDTYYFDGDASSVDEYIRLADIDAPESGDAGYQEAKDYLTSLIHNKWVYLDIDDITGTDPYGRIVGVIYVRHNSTHLLNVNKALIESGYATIWNFDNNEFNPYEWPLYVYYV